MGRSRADRGYTYLRKKIEQYSLDKVYRPCKGGEPACSHFGIAGPYTEWMVLGAVATRGEGKLLWDPKKMECPNNKEASKFVKPVFRRGGTSASRVGRHFHVDET